jgi:ABC-2 type transport system permease protein
MRDLFELHSRVNIEVLTVNRDTGKWSGEFLKKMEQVHTFRLHPTEKDAATEVVKNKMISGDYKFALIIRKNFSAFVEKKESDAAEKPLELLVNPTVSVQTQLVFKSSLDGRLAQLKWDAFLDRIDKLLAVAGIDRRKLTAGGESHVEINYVYRGASYSKIPSAVQQSVPAWLVFSMFFIAIPLSNTFISERAQGTFMRLKSMNVSRFHLLFGKMVPYFLINIIQVLLMIAIGMYIVPLCGGTALTPGHSPGGLFLISASVSFSALSVALLIASVARTTEQATTIGGIMNIIFGALGGIMVPKFVMPGFMQHIANLSPMSWGLEGFLDIFLRSGGVSDVIPESLSLFLFGIVMLTLTVIILPRQRED